MLFGWQIGMLESIILVLVVSLSFDYTLHFAVAVPAAAASPTASFCAEHRIQLAVKRAARPVSAAAASSLAAGAALFASKTHAFYQVSVFLLISSAYSLLYAIAFFLPLLYLTLAGNHSACSLCRLRRIEPMPMQTVAKDA